MVQTFFDESNEQSCVKSAIVAKYFRAWSRVILAAVKRRGGARIAYVDLFAGPGKYADGTRSTPLLVLEQAIQDPELRKALVTIFNDVDPAHAKSLREEIRQLPGIKTLTHAPHVDTLDVAEDIFDRLPDRVIPSLFFVDPWGYKGLSLDLINRLIKDWACECIFFFNYNRINMGLTNPKVVPHMTALFGHKRFSLLQARVTGINPHERELIVIEALCEALREPGCRFVLPFRFRTDTDTRTSHHIVFVGKHFKGYEIMKEVMAGESSTMDQGVASFEYNPATVHQPFLFELTRPLDELGDMLVASFAGKTLTMTDIYEQHNIDRPFIKKNYKSVLIQLEKERRIVANPPASERRKNTFADRVTVEFPAGS